MGLPKAFVGFSSTDIRYRLMLAWKEHEHIDFNFADCQLSSEINSEDENYIKRKCRERINLAEKYVMLSGQIPFDVGQLRAIPYGISADGQPLEETKYQV